MQYKLGQTVIDVVLEKGKNNQEEIWKCTAFVGNSLLAEITSPYLRNDNPEDVEFEFLRIIAWDLNQTISTLLWGGEYEQENNLVKEAYYDSK